MVGWHHRLNGHEFEQAMGDGEGQKGLACCSPLDSPLLSCQWSDMRVTEQQQMFVLQIEAQQLIKSFFIAYVTNYGKTGTLNIPSEVCGFAFGLHRLSNKLIGHLF